MLNRRGITLIELVIAITLTAIVIGMLLGAMRLAYRSEEKGRERSEVAQHMRIVTDRLTWLIHGAYPYKQEDEDTKEKHMVFKGDASSMGFVTTSVDPFTHTPTNNAGLKWIVISASNGLMVQEAMFYDQEIRADKVRENTFIIDPTVRDMQFSYLFTSEESEEWLPRWDITEHDCLPAAVRIKLNLVQGSREIDMPPLVIAVRSGQCVESLEVKSQDMPGATAGPSKTPRQP